MSIQNNGKLIGNLVADPVLRTVNDKHVTTVRLAVNTSQNDTLFTDITLWDKTAELACQYLSKGRKIAVDFYLKNKNATTKSGEEFTTYELVGRDFLFLDSKKEND